MKNTMLSIGIDLGTSTTQMIVSRLGVENTAAPFTIPRMEITSREILYRGGIHFTPLLSADTLDADAIREIVAGEYAKAGIRPQDVETGAVIITGETARKENARPVLEALRQFAGDFVVATAGPALESILASRGAGADRYAKEHRKYVLHMDIGGGTSNLALYGPDGKLLDTGCLNVGGRLIKFWENGEIAYLSPVLSGKTSLQIGETVTPVNLQPLLDILIQALEEAAGLRPVTDCLTDLITDKTVQLPQRPITLSFSGGVADLIEAQEENWLRYGDIGVLLGRTIRASRLCQGDYVLGRETIRATVVGAGSYATQLSGSTVFYGSVTFPLQNLPVVHLPPAEEILPPNLLAQAIRRQTALHPGETVALALRGPELPTYGEITRLAHGIAAGLTTTPLVVVVERDVAKALGQAMLGILVRDAPLVCLDGLHIPPGSYLDVGAPVGAALPVVVKTLAFS